MKANFKTKKNSKNEQKKGPKKLVDKNTDKNFTDLWSFRSKKRQKL